MGLLTTIMSIIPKCSLYTETFWKNATPQDVVRALQSGIDVNAQKQRVYTTDYGESYVEFRLPAFALACQYSLDPEVIRILICQGNADPNRCYYARTGHQTYFIRDALYNPNPEVLRVLLDNGAELTLKDDILFHINIHPIKYKMLLDHNPTMTGVRNYETILPYAKRELEEIDHKMWKSPAYQYLLKDRQYIEKNIELLYEYKADTIDLFLSDEYWQQASLKDVKNRIGIVVNNSTYEYLLRNFLQCMANYCPSTAILTYVVKYCKNKKLLEEFFKDKNTHTIRTLIKKGIKI